MSENHKFIPEYEEIICIKTTITFQITIRSYKNWHDIKFCPYCGESLETDDHF